MIKSKNYQIERKSLFWLLAAMVMSLLPHLTRIPLGLSLMIFIMVIYRVQIYRGRISTPQPYIRWLIIAAGLTIIVTHYQTIFGPEAGVSILILAYSMKLLEMQREKDAYLIVIISYFMLATGLLFQTSLWSSLYLSGVVLVITCALIALNQGGIQERPKATVKLATSMLLFSFPLLVLLFIFFPRIPPFWTANWDNSSHRTGLSEVMSPSDVAKLGRSNALAFRAEFADAIPEASDLYWRSLVFEEFDGRSWSIRHYTIDGVTETTYWSIRAQPYWYEMGKYVGDIVNYELTLEPTSKRYVPTLGLSKPQMQGIGLNRNFTMISRDPVDKVTRFSIKSYLSYSLDLDTTLSDHSNNAMLYDNENPRTRALARQLFAQSGQDISLYVTTVLRQFNEQSFVYTLEPPTADHDIIDHFMFDSKQGFCMHYAGAFVYMMRAVGIPARLIGGFQGGEINPLGGYVLVHQFDAHGWAEIWVEGKGWLRIDPTRYVAPERISSGIESVLDLSQTRMEGGYFNALKVRGSPILNKLRLSLDYLNFTWNQVVVGYDQQKQRNLFDQYFFGLSAASITIILIIICGLISVVMGYILFKLRPTVLRDEVDQAYLHFCKKVAMLDTSDQGLVRLPGEGPNHYLARISQLRPELSGVFREVTALYCEYQFTGARTLSRRLIAKQIRGYRF